MKQKVMIEIESTEFQKALEQEVKGYVKNHLKSLVDGSVGEYAYGIIDKRVTEENVKKIIEAKILSYLAESDWYSGRTTREFAQKIITEKIDSIVSERVSKELWKDIREEVKRYSENVIKEYITSDIKEEVKKTIKEITEKEIKDNVKQIVLEFFKK